MARLSWKLCMGTAGVVLLCATSGLAQPRGRASPSSLQMANPELSLAGSRGGCGASCLYLKANDVMTLQASYLQNLAVSLIRERDRVNDPEPSVQEQAEDKIRATLGAFCRAQKPADRGASLKSMDRCLADYLKTVARSLEMIRAALLKNYGQVLELRDDVPPLPTASLGEAKNFDRLVKDPSILKKKNVPIKVYPDFPFHPSLESIDPIIQRLGMSAKFALEQRSNANGGHETDEALAQWWEQFPRCPSIDEFAKIELVERYPSRPTGEKLPRVVTDRQGRIQYDRAKFDEAMKECSDKKKDHYREFPLELPNELKAQRPSELARSAFATAQESMITLIQQESRKKKGRRADHVTVLGENEETARPGAEPGEQIDQWVRMMRVNAESLRQRHLRK